MRIIFLVASRGTGPSGGIKVIYEYANGLGRLGHNVCVVHFLLRFAKARTLNQPFCNVAKAVGIERAYRACDSMQVSESVKVKLLANVGLVVIPPGDAIVAGTWWLAAAIKDAPSYFGRKYQFVQEYQCSMSADLDTRQRMAKTYQGELRSIVISPACSQMVEPAGGKVFREIPNGLSHDLFRLNEPIDSPLRKSVGFPARTETLRRTQDAVDAIVVVHQQLGDAFDYWCFGSSLLVNLPGWCRFAQRPSHVELVALYKRSAVFIVPSQYEGWGLPGSEAMCCGAPLISTRNGGVGAHAKDGETTVLVGPGRTALLAVAVLDLLADDTKRRQIAERGTAASIRQMTWERSVAAMNAALPTDDPS